MKDLTARAAAHQIAQRQLTSESLTRHFLDRIEERESDVAAWECLDPNQALEQVHQADGSPVRGPLHGVPTLYAGRGIGLSQGSRIA
ncbi:amidase family protein [Bradyrhizobium zhanjiangense]|uniref:Uncharacterized protein n=1 Tax=Bradyrhizobium zhanjiangense TaxID=1325107 RepID=A0A4Q0Q3S0_9BRAD|nr:amidase family protein [Bradyrhizobium zhanjiangense]RXG83578.1 hypothetical protein EAS61_41830 [Bradyrhizobium zhanjiangense]